MNVDDLLTSAQHYVGHTTLIVSKDRQGHYYFGHTGPAHEALALAKEAVTTLRRRINNEENSYGKEGSDQPGGAGR